MRPSDVRVGLEHMCTFSESGFVYTEKFESERGVFGSCEFCVYQMGVLIHLEGV